MQERHWQTAAVIAGGAMVAAAALRRRRGESLEDKVAVITGASRGLGFAIARELAIEGCRLVICARDRAELDRAAEELAKKTEVVAIRCDVGVQSEVDNLIETAIRAFGRIDILVNNAGIIEVGPNDALELDDFRKAMDVMYWGTVYATLAALPSMKARRDGRIVNITSIGGKISVPHLLAYSGAKFAAVGFSEGLHNEVANDGISVTTVVPGLMRTGSYRHAKFKGDAEAEYAWFAVASSMPLLTISGTRAAKQIVRAMKQRAREVVLSVPAKVGVRANGIVPSLVSAIFGMAAQLLPHGTSPATVEGAEAERQLDSEALRRATTLGRRAGRELQQFGAQS